MRLLLDNEIPFNHNHVTFFKTMNELLIFVASRVKVSFGKNSNSITTEILDGLFRKNISDAADVIKQDSENRSKKLINKNSFQ